MQFSPNIALVGAVLDVVADGLEHAAGRGHPAAVKYLQNKEWTSQRIVTPPFTQRIGLVYQEISTRRQKSPEGRKKAIVQSGAQHYVVQLLKSSRGRVCGEFVWVVGGHEKTIKAEKFWMKIHFLLVTGILITLESWRRKIDEWLHLRCFKRGILFEAAPFFKWAAHQMKGMRSLSTFQAVWRTLFIQLWCFHSN